MEVPERLQEGMADTVRSSLIGKAADRLGIHVTVRFVRCEIMTVRRDLSCGRFPELAQRGSGTDRGSGAPSVGPTANPWA